MLEVAAAEEALLTPLSGFDDFIWREGWPAPVGTWFWVLAEEITAPERRRVCSTECFFLLSISLLEMPLLR